MDKRNFPILLLILTTALPTTFITSTSALDSSSATAEQWKDFKALWGKTYYSNSEDSDRMEIYLGRTSWIQDFNQQPNSSYTMTNNKFSDQTEQELQRYLGLVLPDNIPPASPSNELITDNIPDSKDLRLDSCIGPIKDQQNCASSWAFSAIFLIEYSACKKRHQRFTSLSEQKLIDCFNDTTDGCNGGFQLNAWNYFIHQGSSGPPTSITYPYTAKKGDCKPVFSSLGKGLSVVSVDTSIDNMKNALFVNGPLSVGITVIDSLMFYQRGVYDDAACDNQVLNHAVNIVGWGTDASGSNQYWIVRNSWGADWGQGGYFNILQGVNKCGIESFAYYVKTLY